MVQGDPILSEICLCNVRPSWPSWPLFSPPDTMETTLSGEDYDSFDLNFGSRKSPALLSHFHIFRPLLHPLVVFQQYQWGNTTVSNRAREYRRVRSRIIVLLNLELHTIYRSLPVKYATWTYDICAYLTDRCVLSGKNPRLYTVIQKILNPKFYGDICVLNRDTYFNRCVLNRETTVRVLR